MAWNLPLTELMNAVANSAAGASCLRVELAVASACSIPVCTVGATPIIVDVYPVEYVRISASVIPISSISSAQISVITGNVALQVSATNFDVDITETIGVSASTTGAWPICGHGGGRLGISAVDAWGISALNTTSFAVCAHGGGDLPISGDVGLEPYNTLVAGLCAAAAASTAYQLYTQACKSVAVKADDDNTAEVFIGGSTVAGDGANGYRLNAGQGISLRLSNVNLVYFNANTASDKVYWVVIN